MGSDTIKNESERTRRIKESDESAFRDLYFTHAESLFRYFWSRLSNPDLSRDFVQELFTRVWLNRIRLDPSKSIKRYLFKIAENLLIDHFRKQANRKAYLEAKRHRLIRLSGEDPELALQLELAIESLPEKLKSTFLLNRRQGLSHVEIASVLNISMKTVEKRMKKAIAHLRNTLR